MNVGSPLDLQCRGMGSLLVELGPGLHGLSEIQTVSRCENKFRGYKYSKSTSAYSKVDKEPDKFNVLTQERCSLPRPRTVIY